MAKYHFLVTEKPPFHTALVHNDAETRFTIRMGPGSGYRAEGVMEHSGPNPPTIVDIEDFLRDPNHGGDAFDPKDGLHAWWHGEADDRHVMAKQFRFASYIDEDPVIRRLESVSITPDGFPRGSCELGVVTFTTSSEKGGRPQVFGIVTATRHVSDADIIRMVNDRAGNDVWMANRDHLEPLQKVDPALPLWMSIKSREDGHGHRGRLGYTVINKANIATIEMMYGFRLDSYGGHRVSNLTIPTAIASHFPGLIEATHISGADPVDERLEVVMFPDGGWVIKGEALLSRWPNPSYLMSVAYIHLNVCLSGDRSALDGKGMKPKEAQ